MRPFVLQRVIAEKDDRGTSDKVKDPIVKGFVFAVPVVMLLICTTAQSQNEVALKPWLQVYGTVPGEQLGEHVRGLTPRSQLPYRCAIQRHGYAGLYRLSTSTDTAVQAMLRRESLLTADFNCDGWVDFALCQTVVDSSDNEMVVVYRGTATGMDALSPLKIGTEHHSEYLRPARVGDLNNGGTGSHFERNVCTLPNC